MADVGNLYVALGLDTAQFDRAVVAVGARAEDAGNRVQRGMARGAQGFNVLEQGARKAQFALANLTFQMNDVVTGLASGQRPMQILAQQGGQIVQAFAQGGGVGNVLGKAGTAIAAMVTPARLAALGLTALGGAMAFLAFRAHSDSEILRRYNLILEQTGRTAARLDVGGQNARLRALGIDRDLANTQTLAVARSRTAASLGSERLQTIGAGVGAFRGTGPGAGFDELMTAIRGGPEAVIKLAVSLGTLTAAQGANALASTRAGSGMKQLNAAIAAMQGDMKRFATNDMDPLAESANRLAAAWQKLIDTAAKKLPIPSQESTNDFFTAWLETIRRRLFPDTPAPSPGAPVDWRSQQRGGGGQYPTTGGGTGGWLTRNAPFPMQGGPNLPPSPAPSTYLPERPQGLPPLPDNPFGASTHGTSLFGPNAAERMTRYRQRMLGGGGGGGGAPPREVEVDLAVKDSMQRRREEAARLLAQEKLLGIRREAQAAADAARLEISEKQGDLTEQNAAAAAAYDAVLKKYNVTLGHQNDLADAKIAQDHKIAAAYLESAAAVARVTAEEKARIEVWQAGAGDAGRRAQQLLDAKSARAGIELGQGIQGDRETRQAVELRTQLLGASTEEIDRQVALLRIRQQIEAAGVPVNQALVDARVKEVDALSKSQVLLAKRQELYKDLQDVAGVFENAFSRAFDSIADGTFKLRDAMRDIMKDIGKMVMNQAFRRLFYGEAGGGGGIMGTLFGAVANRLIGPVGGGAATATATAGGSNMSDYGYATGGSFMVGGSGALDSQLVAFRASPGERVDITPGGMHGGGGGGEDININLNPSEGWVAGVANQQIVSASGQIINVAVIQSERNVARHFGAISTDARARQM